MKRVAIFFSDPDPEGPPLDNAGYRVAYAQLSSCIDERGGECFVVRGRDHFMGEGNFSHGWRIDVRGGIHPVEGPLHADVVYNKGESFAADRCTLLVNKPALDTLCRDKEQTLKRYKMFMPKTAVARSPGELRKVLGGRSQTSRIVVKPTQGWGGRGVVIGTSAEVMENVEAFPVLVQEFVDTSKGIPCITTTHHDLRCVVVNGSIALCTVRTPVTGSLVANVATGGSLTIIPSDSIPREPMQIVKTIDRSLQKHGTRIYSVDFGLAENGTWFVFELNPQPGLTAPHWGSGVRSLYGCIAQALLDAA